jgi:anti-anti-sigma regulatory factor
MALLDVIRFGLVRLTKRAWQRRIEMTYVHPTAAVQKVLALTRLNEYLLGPAA